MITSILAAFPEGDLFKDIVIQLQQIAVQPVEQDLERGRMRLPQVHALNCLKDIFTDTRLGSSTEEHLERTFGIAVGCLNHEM